MEHTDLELYIQIRDGQPHEHPIFADNFKLAFPDVDVNNLPADRFAKFIRVAQPIVGTYEVYEGVTYEWVDGVVKDVHSVRPMTDEERAAKTAELEAGANQAKLDRIAFINDVLTKETDETAQTLWLDCLSAHEAWALESGATPMLYERTVDPRWQIDTDWWEILPDRWDEVLEPERLDLLVAELQQVIATIEARTGRRFDEARFIEVMHLVNEQEEYYRKTRDLIAQTIPAPIGIVDSMPATMVPQWHRGTVWGRDAAKAFYEEVAARVAQKQAAVPDEQVRLMWVGRGLWSNTGFYQKWEESHGAIFVWSMYLALAADGYIRNFDRGRDPLRALAARFLTMGDELRMPSWAAPWHVHEAQTHGIDGAVALTDADPFVLRALVAAGIPVLELGVDNYALDRADADELERRIADFITGPCMQMAARRKAPA